MHEGREKVDPGVATYLHTYMRAERGKRKGEESNFWASLDVSGLLFSDVFIFEGWNISEPRVVSIISFLLELQNIWRSEPDIAPKRTFLKFNSSRSKIQFGIVMKNVDRQFFSISAQKHRWSFFVPPKLWNIWPSANMNSYRSSPETGKIFIPH